jgi:hypothetical protein
MNESLGAIGFGANRAAISGFFESFERSWKFDWRDISLLNRDFKANRAAISGFLMS